MAIMTNVPVLVTILFKFASGITTYIMLSEIPTFFSNVFYLDVSEISNITMINYIVYVTGMIVSAKISEELIIRGCLSRSNSRKAFSVCSGVVNAVTVALIPFSRCNKLLVIFLVYFSALMESFCMASDIPLFAEMTNKFPGVLYAIFQVASLSPGFIAPMYSGLVLGYVSDQWVAWDIIFYSTSCFLVFANVIFLMYGSATIQSFDHLIKAEVVADDDASDEFTGVEIYRKKSSILDFA
jgi:MFS family permease